MHAVGEEEAMGKDAGRDPLEGLRVIPRLEVGPVTVAPNRVAASYRVTRDGETEATELAYRFEEDVFDPDEPDGVNLANMLCAQVALNYGLFCREIVFRGRFDAVDRQFLVRMAENTAREIFVKKILEPNALLKETMAGPPPVRRESYLQARLRFPGEPAPAGGRPGPGGAGRDPWPMSRSRCAVLSSGGKESLLSFGLLREIGVEVHPVFVNESGRHWFTALNAYRHFSAHVPHTARVWTNADRVFNWMLRHVPFVREDFAEVRSDAYPLRLWTVAVFLFGVLPLLRKRGIGRLVIGDEYDTTQRRSFEGIPHYDGLYDQSRYFDNALTRYFQRKGWGISQFSVLRGHSELLVERLLVERYPELLALQTSCHAAHKEGDRVRPCGRCEKCRRVVGMLVGLEADPQACGYTKEQIHRCLRLLPEKGVHQEPADVQHLAYLLNREGFLEGGSIGGHRARSRPEVMKLRWEPRRSPPEAVPMDLRRPLYGIFREHADGAVMRSGRVWIDFDPSRSPAASRPYIFESACRPSAAEPAREAGNASRGASCLLGELNWPEAQRRFKEVDVALLPVGSTEQHGPHLPLDTDAFHAEYLAREVAGGCTEPRPLVLPLIPYGVSYHHDDFSGTLSVSPETLSRMVYEIGMHAARQGITKLLIINGHGGNTPALHYAAQMINRDGHIFTCVDTGETSDPDIFALAETPNDVHAGEIETSLVLALRPELVRMTAARESIPRFSSRYLDFSSQRSVSWYARTSSMSPTGVLGDPTRATAEKGRRFWALMIRHLVDFVERIKAMTLDEITQGSDPR